MSERSPATDPVAVVLAWSGGKDCAYALHELRRDPAVRVAALLTTVTAEYDRISIHGVRRALLHRQAAAAELPLVEAAIPARASNEAYDAAMAAALDEVRRRFPAVRGVAFGDLFLEDVRAYRESRLAGTGFRPLFPLWGRPTDRLAREIVDAGIRATLVCVDTGSLDARFAGRAYDRALLAELPAGVDPCGERGEFHTFVAEGPMFRRPVPVEPGELVLRDGRWAYHDLLPADGAAAAAPPDAPVPPPAARDAAGARSR